MSDPQNAESPSPVSERLYTPEPGELQLTFRAVFAGCVLGAVVASMNIYFGLKTGWSIGGSLIAAILGFSVFSAIRSVFPSMRPYSVLETNITQTAGSAAGSMTSTAGLLAAIPALGMMGIKLSYFELTLWAGAVAFLGVFFAVPLRNQMVVVEKLRFPTGTATAETIMSMFADGEVALRQARVLLISSLIAAAFTLLVFFLPELGHPPLAKWTAGIPLAGTFFAALSSWTFSLIVSPLMIGAGILIGPRVALSLFLGAVFSWGLLGPGVQEAGWVDGSIMSYKDGVRGWLLWPGVAIMVADAMAQLGLSWRTILNTFTRPKKGEAPSAAELEMEPIEDQIPNSWWIIGLGIGSTATILVSWLVFSIAPWMTVIAIALSSILAMIAVRSTGETDINPIGGMGKVTQLVFGGVAPGQTTTNLMAAAIAGAGASQAGDMMQDLKTGRLLGASPRKQIIAQSIGILAGIIICVPIYKIFDEAYDIGYDDEFAAPAAHAWKAMAELLSEGFGALPLHSEWAVLCGMVFGIAMAVIKKKGPEKIAAYTPSGLAFGIAFIIPAFYSVAMFLGMVVYSVWNKVSPAAATALGISVASGLIAGEGLMGVVTAVITLLNK